VVTAKNWCDGTRLSPIVFIDRTKARKDMKYSTKLIIFCLCFISNTAFACSTCVISEMEYFLPGSIVWWFFLMGWYLLLTIENRVKGNKRSKLGSPLFAIFLVLISFVIGAIGLGSFLVFPFSLVCIIWVAKRLSRFLKHKSFAYLINELGISGSLGIFIFLGLTFFSVSKLMVRTEEQYFCQYPLTSHTSSYLGKLKADEPNSLETYRKLALHHDFFVAHPAIKRIAEIGDPVQDVPLLIKILKQVQESPASYKAQLIASQLTKLSDLELKVNASAVEWEKSWESKNSVISNPNMDTVKNTSKVKLKVSKSNSEKSYQVPDGVAIDRTN
jgi:hypothetical protein